MRTNIKKLFLSIFITLLINIFASSCFIYNGYQTARLIKKNDFEITPTTSLTSYNFDNNHKTKIPTFGLRSTYGIADWSNISLNYTRIQIPEFNIGYNYADLNLQFRIIKDYLAFSIFTGLYFGDYVQKEETANVSSSIQLTYPITKFITVTISPHVLLFLRPICILYTINTNFEYNFQKIPLSVIPEFGVTYTKSEDHFLLHGGIGFNWLVYKKVKTK